MRGFVEALERLRGRIVTRFPDEDQSRPFLHDLEALLHAMPKYEYGMTIAVEDGVVKLHNYGGKWSAEAIVNEDGGYMSVTLNEGHLRALVDFIDRQRAVAA